MVTVKDDPGLPIPMRRFTNTTRYHRLVDEEPEASSPAGEEAAVFSDFEDLDKDEDELAEAATRLLRQEVSTGLAAPGTEKRFWFQRSSKIYDPDAIATQESVFDDPDMAEEFLPSDSWENTHRFDIKERWTWGEEHRLIRKIDARIMVFAAIMFMALELDRSNISQALTDNLLDDLGMTTNDYNLGNSLFKLAFLCAELPSQLVAKMVGPDVWIPVQMVVWSVVGASQFWMKGKTSFLVCRALLGMLQGGFIPEVILYLSYFYKHHELSLRLGFFWTASGLADVLGAFLAFGLLRMRGVDGKSGWRWLFLVEGLLTLIIGLFAFVLMPSSPTSTASWFRGEEGWFSEREEKIMVNRILREDPSKSSMHNREPLTPALLWQSMKDFDLWPMYLLGLTFQTPMSAPSNYVTLILKDLGFGTFQTNLLVIPTQVFHVVNMLALTYAAEVFGELTFTSLIGQIWALPFIVLMNVVDINQMNHWVSWGVMTALLCYPSAHPIQVGWNSRNSNTVRARTVSAALYNMCVQTSGIIAANIYRKDDAPRYKRGNRVLLLLLIVNISLYLATKAYYVKRNSYRDKKWGGMTEDEKLLYLATTTDEGNKRLDFRFAH